MEFIKLEADEVIILEASEVEYKGSAKETTFLDKLYLTNKRIVGKWEGKKTEHIFEVNLADIKRYGGNLQIENYYDDNIGKCLRLQTTNGIELFGVNDLNANAASITGTFKSMFSMNSKEDKCIALWIQKIKEIVFGESKEDNYTDLALDSKQDDKVRKKTETIVDRKNNDTNEEKKSEDYQICPKCGASITKDSRFCSKCGASVIEPQIIEVEKIVEVIKCRKCGAAIDEGAKFCSKCGTPVIEEAETQIVPPPIKKEVRSNKVFKCASCGEILPSDAAKCPLCGWEVKGREAVESVQLFFEELQNIASKEKRLDVIKLYTIPNNKEDIMEFMVLAVSNFDSSAYDKSVDDKNIADAWKTKIEQCYHKAMSMFTDPKDITKIERLYSKIREKEVIDTVRGFFEKIKSYSDVNDKIDAIKAYTIPNNMEEITELMFFAVSSFDAEIYVTNMKVENIAAAWYTKIEQCYRKVSTLFANSEYKAKIDKLYQDVNNQIKDVKRKRLLFKICGISMIIISCIMTQFLPKDSNGEIIMGPLAYITSILLIAGIVVLVRGCKKKKERAKAA